MRIESSAHRALHINLRSALANKEFELHYQPIVEIRSGEIATVEALLRWRDPQHRRIGPSDFIPLAERTGLIKRIGEWVLHEACSTAVRWPSQIKVSVNVSPVQFQNASPFDDVCKALDGSGLPPERLELEVTESVLLHYTQENLETLNRLRLMGIAIVLDDFGTGYSSLSYLKMFPFSKIKIDRLFVDELPSNTDCGSIVSAVAGLARSLRMRTVAEGVETEEQLAVVRAAGCTHAQGFLFDQPRPVADLKFSNGL